jgi:hypothetical protein
VVVEELAEGGWIEAIRPQRPVPRRRRETDAQVGSGSGIKIIRFFPSVGAQSLSGGSPSMKAWMAATSASHPSGQL